jgi:hypothetical protein
MGDGGVDWRIILKWLLKEQGVRIWTGFICFRTGASDEIF